MITRILGAGLFEDEIDPEACGCGCGCGGRHADYKAGLKDGVTAEAVTIT